MNISQYIQSIVTQSLPNAHYEYGRNVDFNINGDDVPSDVVLCIEPDQQFLNLSPLVGTITDGYNLFIRFIQLIPNIDIAEQAPTRVTAIDTQKKNAAQFIMDLSNDDLFKDLATPIQVVSVIEAYDGNWFGVEVNLKNLETIEPLEVC